MMPKPTLVPSVFLDQIHKIGFAEELLAFGGPDCQFEFVHMEHCEPRPIPGDWDLITREMRRAIKLLKRSRLLDG